MKIADRLSFETFFLILVIVGYVVFSALAIPLGIENSRIFAVPYRLLVAVISVFFIFKNKDNFKIAALPAIFLLLFWALYFVKSWWSFRHDSYSAEVLAQENETYTRIFLIALLPSLALLVLNYKKVNLKTVAFGCFSVLFISLIINAVYGFFHVVDGKVQHIFSIYYISYGHLGTSLFLISLYMLLFKNNENFKFKYLWISGLLVGAYIVLEGFARSPFLALVISTFFLFLVKGSWKYLVYFVCFLLLLLGLDYVMVKSGTNRLIFAERVYKWIFEGDNSLRTPLFRTGLDIFKQNPVIGGRVLFQDGMYPHNILIELLMATGIVGFILYFAKFIPIFKTGKFFFKNSEDNYQVPIFALFLQYSTLVMTSYSLIGTPEFLHLGAVVIGLSLYYKNEKIKSNDRRGDTARDYKALAGLGGAGRLGSH